MLQFFFLPLIKMEAQVAVGPSRKVHHNTLAISNSNNNTENRSCNHKQKNKRTLICIRIRISFTNNTVNKNKALALKFCCVHDKSLISLQQMEE